ncbi:thioredoxin [Archaeoglobus sulfaticallidus PM70-1]|uniref:Thioredoxin n=2 Tax=Archaeoglobus TaxID=2233 RepID=N0BB89_9EURY|nr:thioredoxin [Archaeoglobus sulfaticallidus PM70-1]
MIYINAVITHYCETFKKLIGKLGFMDELEIIRKKKLMEKMERMMGEKMEKINYPVNVTQSNFNEILKNRYVVLDFWADWCAPCKMIAPIIDDLAREYDGKVVFGKVNTTEEQAIANRFAITAIPTLIFFRNGKPVDKIVGAMPKGELIRWINKNMV